jgi:hypothetical protein
LAIQELLEEDLYLELALDQLIVRAFPAAVSLQQKVVALEVPTVAPEAQVQEVL